MPQGAQALLLPWFCSRAHGAQLRSEVAEARDAARASAARAEAAEAAGAGAREQLANAEALAAAQAAEVAELRARCPALPQYKPHGQSGRQTTLRMWF